MQKIGLLLKRSRESKIFIAELAMTIFHIFNVSVEFYGRSGHPGPKLHFSWTHFISNMNWHAVFFIAGFDSSLLYKDWPLSI